MQILYPLRTSEEFEYQCFDGPKDEPAVNEEVSSNDHSEILGGGNGMFCFLAPMLLLGMSC